MTGIMLTEPKAVTKGNYKLLPGGEFHKERRGKVKGAVVHVTAGLQDLGMSGSDESAEGTNRWALESGVVASWYRISDSDGVVSCLPTWYTAYQAKGYNSSTVGNECANKDARWDNKPKEWVKWTLWYYALSYADYVVKYKIPVKRATQAELDRAIKYDLPPVGFVDHSRLSDNRSDPGKTFPWEQFFRYIKQIIAGYELPDVKPTPPKPVPPEPTPSQEDSDVFVYQLTDHKDPKVAAAIIISDGFRMRWANATYNGWVRINGAYKFQHGEDLFVTKVGDLGGVAVEWVGPLPTPDFPIPPGVVVVRAS